jgi:beta-lactamase regulating signal transducer with metallopeptidase domain
MLWTFLEAAGRFAVVWTLQIAFVLAPVWIGLRLDVPHRPLLRYRIWVLALITVCLLPLIPLMTRWLIGGFDSAPAVVPGLDGPSIYPSRLLRVIGLTWFMGMSYELFRRIQGVINLRHISAAASPTRLQDLFVQSLEWESVSKTDINVRLSCEIASPMLYGLVSPVILLPHDIAEWTSEPERRAMVSHELIHLLRRDHWTRLLDSFLAAVLFFHPLVRLACRRLDAERELACDAKVLESGADPAVYAEAILKAAERGVISNALCGSVGFVAAQLSERIHMLFEARHPTGGKALFGVLTAIVLAFAMLEGVFTSPVLAQRQDPDERRRVARAADLTELRLAFDGLVGLSKSLALRLLDLTAPQAPPPPPAPAFRNRRLPAAYKTGRDSNRPA